MKIKYNEQVNSSLIKIVLINLLGEPSMWCRHSVILKLHYYFLKKTQTFYNIINTGITIYTSR